MSEQQADTTELRRLAEQMQQLVAYCDALASGASGFAYMLPAEWQGPAMAAFLDEFATWHVGADGLRAGAEGLQQLAAAATGAYEQTITGLDSSWSSFRSTVEA